MQEMEPVHNFRFFIKSQNFTRIVTNRKLIFGLYGLLGYTIQFLMICTVLNAYSDISRFCPCDGLGKNYEDQRCDLRDDKFENEEKLDSSLALLGAYHLIEWVRFIIFMVAVFLGTDVIRIYYVLYLNTILGLIAYIMAHV